MAWLEATRIARAIAGSTAITGTLSSIHLIGLALITGGALFSNLAGFGVLSSSASRIDAIRPAARAVTAGLAVSVTTGLLLFSSRASTAIENGNFRLKMTLLALAVLLHVTLQRANRHEPASSGIHRAGGTLALLLWIGVALAGCAFIFLE
jgi:hypothetical protein